MRSTASIRAVVVVALSVSFVAARGRAEAAPAQGGNHQASQGPYHLFRPVPRHQMRELSADRPDGTESPITVDAGHFQAELSLFDLTRDKAGALTDTWNVMDVNLKLGLVSHVDLQLGFAAYTIVKSRDAGVTTTTHGFGDLTLRLKINLWGNDGGKTALGLLPWVTIPSYSRVGSERPETGIVTAFSWSIIERVGVGSQLGFSTQWDEALGRYSLSVEHTFVVGVSIWGPLGAFVEYIGVANAFPSVNPYQGVFSGGVTVGIGKNIQLDAATQVGLTKAADDFKLFTGLTFRI